MSAVAISKKFLAIGDGGLYIIFICSIVPLNLCSVCKIKVKSEFLQQAVVLKVCKTVQEKFGFKGIIIIAKLLL